MIYIWIQIQIKWYHNGYIELLEYKKQIYNNIFVYRKKTTFIHFLHISVANFIKVYLSIGYLVLLDSHIVFFFSYHKKDKDRQNYSYFDICQYFVFFFFDWHSIAKNNKKHFDSFITGRCLIKINMKMFISMSMMFSFSDKYEYLKITTNNM